MWDQRKHDYLDNFVPFIATLLETRQIRRIEGYEIVNLCNQFEDEFDLKIPDHAMRTVLNRCVRRKVLRRLQHGYTVDVDVAAKLSFSQDRANFSRREKNLLEHFVAYVKSTFGKDIEVKDAEDALFDFIHRYDMEILLLRNGTQSALPEKPRSKNNRQLAYMLGHFAINAYESRPAVFATMSEIALGNILTAAVLLDGYDWPSDTVRKSHIYLDSPIILRMIGTDGESQATALRSFVSMLKTNGAKLWIFNHSKTEALQILEGARYWVGRNDFDPEKASRPALYFRQQGYTDSEIGRFILRVDGILRKYHIRVFETHPYMVNKEYQLDEDRVRQAIESCYRPPGPGVNRDVSDDRILKDVASITAVYRLRAGRRATLLRDASHVFVSMNPALSRASRIAVEEDARSPEIPACVTDVFLGTIMWINSPQVAKEASRRRLIADCYSAVTPDRSLETRIVYEARRLLDQGEITDDDFLLLTTSFITKDLLSEKTLNDPESLDSRTSLDILEDIKDGVRKDERDLRAAVELEKEHERRARERAEREHAKESERVKNIIDDQVRMRATIMNVIHAVAVGFGVIVIPVLSLLVGRWQIAASFVGLCVAAYLSFGRGFTLKSNYERLCAKYRDRFRAKYADE